MTQKETFIILIILLSFTYIFYIPSLEANEIDLASAQESVGKRFASKFCEAKENGFSSESSSDFALNNTYLKFVTFPDDENFLENLWDFTLLIIRKDCGEYVTQNEENNLKDFFEEEGKIASNRDFYLPN
tara:strand:+ start:959 stop:1348 length:390 start_codon:yes stop_codon:yes gene_type:complete